MKKKNSKSKLDQIRKEIKLSRKEQKEREFSIIQKNLGRSKSYIPLEKDLQYKNFDESSQLKKYLDARFNRIDDNINIVKSDIKEMKSDIKEVKSDIKEIQLDSKYALLMNALSHNLFNNESAVRKTIRDYINKEYNNLGKKNKKAD